MFRLLIILDWSLLEKPLMRFDSLWRSGADKPRSLNPTTLLLTLLLARLYEDIAKATPLRDSPVQRVEHSIVAISVVL